MSKFQKVHVRQTLSLWDLAFVHPPPEPTAAPEGNDGKLLGFPPRFSQVEDGGWGRYFHFIGEESGARKLNEFTLNSEVMTGRTEVLNHNLQSPNALPISLSSINLKLAMFPAWVSGGTSQLYSVRYGDP